MPERCPMCGTKACGVEIFKLGFVKLNLQEIDLILHYLSLFYADGCEGDDLSNAIENLKSHRQGLKVREALKDSKPLEPHQRDIAVWNIPPYDEDAK